MTLLDRVRTCHDWRPEDYRPLRLGGQVIGRVAHDFARRLADFPETVEVSEDSVTLNAKLANFENRSAAIAEVLDALVASGQIKRLRGEYYPVVPRWGDPPLFKIDRGAVPDFGIRGYGVHMNGIVRTAEGLKLWVGKRSMTKATGPGKLDHLVAGGQPYGLGIAQNVVKEAGEEAALPEALARHARATGYVSYRCRRDEGLRDDVLFCFDLELPEDFTPKNTDGEVDWFQLWPIEQVVQRMSETDDFKFNVALVNIDLLIRHGLLGPDEPHFMEIAEGLRLKGEG